MEEQEQFKDAATKLRRCTQTSSFTWCGRKPFCLLVLFLKHLHVGINYCIITYCITFVSFSSIIS
jgi:hypothetical protein